MIRRIVSLFKRRWVYRSSITGKFVSKAFYEANADITVRERI